MNSAPVVKDVVLVGGGHSHVLLIRMWAMQPIPGVRLTLISEKVETPYSGMLPGLIAGHYTQDDVHIDLARLCAWANVRFIEQRVTAVNLPDKNLQVEVDRPSIGFDVLSLDTGSTPELNIKGSRNFSVPVKPVHGFYSRWQAILARMDSHASNSSSDHALSLGVVGSGAGGFELVMAMRHALPVKLARCHWFVRGARVLKGRPEKVSELAMQAAKDAGVIVHEQFDVVEVQEQALLARDGRSITLDEIVWCAAAKAPAWPKAAGFSVDERGFVFTNAHLQSESHGFVFATGDIGTQRDTPSDKAGVFAVRQAPILFQNIRRYLLNTQLKTYRPQKDFLSLMATGAKSAIGNRGPITVQGAWVWRLKDMIDQKFMNQFRLLPAMHSKPSPFSIPKALLSDTELKPEDVDTHAMRCSGCGGKVGATVLDSVLSNLHPLRNADVLSGLDEAEDAAVLKAQPNVLVQSVDQISAVCSDPYVFGRIAAVHALSDVVACAATAHSAQAIVSLPFADRQIVKRDLEQLMAGVVDALNADECSLIGGHTSESSDVSLGFVINGYQDNAVKRIEDKTTTASVGDHLVLTKPIGSGVLLAGMMHRQAKGRDVQQLLTHMQLSNRIAASDLFEHQASAVTDVTGFGLLGHLQRLLTPIGLGAALDLGSVPVYPGALDLAQSGIRSTLLNQNQQVLSLVTGTDDQSDAWLNLLCDPQTSGGLLGLVPAAASDAVLNKLRDHGCEHACIIGRMTADDGIKLI